uniref:SPRY domain-containing protein n=1 Tax=Astatotilapia calliptera TaxID=8154 RepID=A0AAX7TLS8_ASTCA
MAAMFTCCLGCCGDGGSGHIPLKEMPTVQLDTHHMGTDVVIVKSGRRICGTGGCLANAPLHQNKSYFEFKIQSTGVWGVGVATQKVNLNQVPMGRDTNSLVLRHDGSIYHNNEEKNRLPANSIPQEGDIVGPDGLGIEAPLESLCPCLDDAEPSTRLQKLEQFVARMGRVLQYLRCSSPASPGVGVLERGESNPAAAFCCTDHSLESFLVLHTAVPEPRCHVLCEDALHSACIENPEDLWRDPELPQLS